jgi:hypothetical protein
MNSSTTELIFINSVQGGFGNRSRNSTTVTVSTHVTTLWAGMRKVTPCDAFLCRTVTDTETWIHQCEPGSKPQSREWKHRAAPAKKKFRCQPTTGRFMLTLIWDSHGPVLELYQERGVTISSACYSEMLRDNLKLATQSKRRGQLSQTAVLLHESSRPHTGAHAVQPIQLLPWSFTVGLSSFEPLKKSLSSRIHELKEAVHPWHATRPKTFFSEGLDMFVQRWTKCVGLC